MGDTVVVTEKNNGTTVSIKNDDSLVVQLRGNPTTGYRWVEYYLEGDAIIQNGKPSYQPDRSHPGSPGTFTFPYVAVSSGDAKLRMVKARDWESQPIASYYLVITVE